MTFGCGDFAVIRGDFRCGDFAVTPVRGRTKTTESEKMMSFQTSRVHTVRSPRRSLSAHGGHREITTFSPRITTWGRH